MVDEDAAPLALQPLRRHEAGMPRLEQPGGGGREVVRLPEARAATDRREHVDPVGAARLHVAGKLELVEQLPHQVRDLDRLREPVRLVRRVEVEDDVVRAAGQVDPRVPRIHVDAVHLHHPEERVRRVDEREVHLA
jgi:hypothetical protein